MRAATAAMGTRFEIVVAGLNEHAARPIMEEALGEIDELHQQLNRFASDSLVSFINRTAGLKPVRLDSNLFELFGTALSISTQSDSAFDITIGTGTVSLDPEQRSIRLQPDSTEIDLGGIAKGYALDRAGAVLRAHGVQSALLHGGTSSVLAIGAPPGARAWRIAVAHTRGLCIDLKDSTLSVSRPHAQTRGGDTHIIDPRTRASIAERRVAVVCGPSAAIAEGWSTALAVLGARPQTIAADYQTWITTEYDAE